MPGKLSPKRDILNGNRITSNRKEDFMTTPQHCPGFEQLKSLKSFVCKCPNCGREAEIFSDEFDKKHFCKGCRQQIDFTKCTLESGV